MTGEQRFLLLLILVGALATVLAWCRGAHGCCRTRSCSPWQALRLGCCRWAIPRLGGALSCWLLVPGLIFEAALTLDLVELRRRMLPVSLLLLPRRADRAADRRPDAHAARLQLGGGFLLAQSSPPPTRSRSCAAPEVEGTGGLAAILEGELVQ